MFNIVWRDKIAKELVIMSRRDPRVVTQRLTCFSVNTTAMLNPSDENVSHFWAAVDAGDNKGCIFFTLSMPQRRT